MNELIKIVIGAIYEVANTLGTGFLEKVYERALISELRLRGLETQAQIPVRITYKGTLVGEYYADIIVFQNPKVEWKRVVRNF
ncbi:MAG TPA: GxxExxY protein [Acidobacteriota bacterium]|nr:GxxExxY protein [Acidobacteriota bacterium]